MTVGSSALAAEVVGWLASAGMTVATCESLTGGLLAGALTSVPGSSAVVRGGLVTYATDLKVSLAGVSTEVIEQSGVVSEPTALAMAAGVARACGATWGVSTTGVAGPDAVDGQPVGRVWIGVAGPCLPRAGRVLESVEPTASARCFDFPGDRAAVRERTVEAALRLLLEACGAS